MHRRILATLRPFALIVLLAPLAIHGQSGVGGKWEGETDGGSSIVLDLTVNDTALTGTLTRNGQSTPLADGKVSKNQFTFKATLNEQTEGFSGELDGDRLRVWLDRQGPTKAVVFTRVRSK
jgi:hypothetical protein